VGDPYALKDPYDEKRPKTKLTGRLRSAGVIVGCVVVLVVLAAAGLLVFNTLTPPNITAYAADGISISGLSDEDYIVTPDQLIGLDCEQTSASGSGSGQFGESKAGSVAAYGPFLETFLQSQGFSLSDFTRIKVYCKDGYSVILRPDMLEGEPILSVADGSEALAPYQRPLRMVIPGETTGKWAFGILRMEFVR
jgi:hypothetical protein